MMNQPYPDYPALALLEFNSIAFGILAGDGMVKQSPVAQLLTGTIQPGHYLVLVTGNVAEVEDAFKLGQTIGTPHITDRLFLPNIHPAVVGSLYGERTDHSDHSVGIIETNSVASAIAAADAGIKGADVTLWQLRLGDGLGGKGLVIFKGAVADIEAAVEFASLQAKPHLLQQIIIPQMHEEMSANMATYGRFGDHFQWRLS